MVSRRDFIKKASYTAPAVLTMSAVPSFASAGSNHPKKVKGDKLKNRRRNRRGRRGRLRRGNGRQD